MTYMSPPSCFSVDICPEVLLAGLTVGAAAGFFALYQQITKKGRRKRDSSLHTVVYDSLNLLLNNGKKICFNLKIDYAFRLDFQISTLNA